MFVNVEKLNFICMFRDEMYQQRIKLELEEEQRKEREKALLMEKKAARIEAVKKATIQAIKETQEIKRRGFFKLCLFR